jgi:GT2 family glycosyltransferase
LNRTPSVAIVILNWNGKQYLEQFLPSVIATSYANARVVVADNGSTDDSLGFLQQYYPTVQTIELEKNYGFAGGYNEALKRVEADYYVLLNSDVEVTPGWLEPMISLLESDKDFAVCQPKLLAYHSPHLFEYAGAAGGWLDAFGYPFARGRIFEHCEEDRGQYQEVQEVFWATGAALVVKSTVYHQVNGFDPYFFAHQEEIDLCWRIKLHGYRVFCHPQSVVYHVGGGTLPRGNTRKTFLNFRNNHIMMAKNMAPAEKWWKVPFRLLLDQVSATKQLLSGEAGYFVAIQKAHWAYFNWLLTGPKEPTAVLRKPLNRLTGVYKGIVVWDYFVKKRNTFAQIIAKQS